MPLHPTAKRFSTVRDQALTVRVDFLTVRNQDNYGNPVSNMNSPAAQLIGRRRADHPSPIAGSTVFRASADPPTLARNSSELRRDRAEAFAEAGAPRADMLRRSGTR